MQRRQEAGEFQKRYGLEATQSQLTPVGQETIDMDDACPVWQVAADAQLKLRYWDNECVLYHGASGDTHRLPDLIGHLLERLLLSPASVASLAEAIDLHEEDVETAVNELAGLGITELAP